MRTLVVCLVSLAAAAAFGCHNKSKTQPEIKNRERYEQSCEMSVALSCFNMGVMNLNGIDGPQIKANARKYFKKGCDLGHARSCVDLGLMLHQGQGGQKNDTLALEYAQKACGLGDTTICQLIDNTLDKGYQK